MSDAAPDTRAWWQKRKWRVWFAGIAQGIIHGAATTGGAVLGIGAANVAGVPVPQLNAKQLGAVLLAGSVSGGIAYLRQSPWPRDEDDTAHLTASGNPPQKP